MTKIAILLSTYNGALYLKEQLDSLLLQNFQDFLIIARDDGSTDGSYGILQYFMQHSSLNIIVLEERTNLGVKKSFELLLQKALTLQAPYIMFADQDDIWTQDKVGTTLSTMKELEMKYPLFPLLVHSDLSVVDARLEMLASSFWSYQHIDPSKDSPNRLLLHNVVTGCTMIINRALAEKVKTIPDEAIMHDWWIAMVASAFGKIAYINEPLILYRQHGQNDTGAKKYGAYYFIKIFLTVPTFEKYIEQSKAFLALYGHELDTYRRLMLEEFSNIKRLSKFQKIRLLFKYKIWKNGFMRNLGLVVFI